MTIPGISDFYDGLHQQMVNELEAAQLDAEHRDHNHDDQAETVSVRPDLDHDHEGHLLAGSEASQQESAQPSLLSHLLPAALTGIATAATRFASEYLTEAAVSGALLGEGDVASPHSQDDSLHVVSMEHGEFHHQTDRYSCALACPKMILDSFHAVDKHGDPFSEDHLTYLATANGWFNGKGMALDHVGDLLKEYGISAHQGQGWPNMVHELAAGHQVVMSVNNHILWSEDSPLSELAHLIANSPNHAIVVKGLRVNDHNRVVVVINDPGQADGAGVEYPFEHFQSAVDGSQLHYIATDEAPRDWHPQADVQNLLPESHQNADTNPHGANGDSFADLVSQMTDAEHSDFLRNV